MGVSTSAPEAGVAVVTVDFPPVNALPVRGWYDLAAAVRTPGARPDGPCVGVTPPGPGVDA
ncbi:enoyl-CoA hydratase, partial [Streptomyces sp. NPDC088184]